MTVSLTVNFTYIQQAPSPQNLLTDNIRVLDTTSGTFLRGFGVRVDHVRLGTCGNGHLMFMERKNSQIKL